MNMEKSGTRLKKIHFVRLAFLILLLFIFVVLPNRSNIGRQQSAYSSMRTEMTTQQKAVKQLQERLAKLEQAQKDFNYIYSNILLPKKTGVPEIRLELESLVDDLQIKREDFSHTYSPLPKLKLTNYNLGVPVQGNYRSIRRFINSIERSKHFLILDRVDLSSEPKADILNLNFALSTYLVDDGT
jgi:Tfp pilus assembly protein PilO